MNLVVANSVVVLTFLVLLQLHGESNAEALPTHHLKHGLLNKLHNHLEKYDKYKQDDDQYKQCNHDKYNDEGVDNPKHLPPPPPLPPSGPHLPPPVHLPIPKPRIPFPNNPFSVHGAPPIHPLPHSYPRPGQDSVRQDISEEIDIDGYGNSINKLIDVDADIHIPITIDKN